jgi:O-antigen/teichoic acid export membrane protein
VPIPERLRDVNPLPEGTLAVGAGLVLNGVGAYAFLVLSARQLGPAEFAPLSVLWALAFLVAPGLFLPLEQEVSRAVASRRARNEGALPVVRHAAVIGGVLLGVVVVVSLVASGWLLDRLFDGQGLLLSGFVLALVGYCAAHLVRGLLSGNGRFGDYALYFGTEGVLRGTVGIAFLAVGVSSAGWYGLTVGIVPFVAITVALVRPRGLLVPGPESRAGELTTALGSLLAASMFTALLLNAGPIAVELLATEAESDEAGRFLAGLVIARVPLFLFQAVQASLLPRLALYAGGRQWEQLAGALRRLVLAVAGLGATATLVAWAIGPEVVRLFFGEEFALGHRDLGLLALSSGTFMVAVALGQALIALGAAGRMALGWAAGVAAFAAVTAAGDDLYLRVELGLVAGTLVVALGLAALVRARLAAERAADAATVATAERAQHS